jgi:hypothetical protein
MLEDEALLKEPWIFTSRVEDFKLPRASEVIKLSKINHVKILQEIISNIIQTRIQFIKKSSK